MGASDGEQRLTALLAAVPGFVFVLDANGQYLDVMGTEAPLLAPLGDLRGKYLSDVFPPEDAAICLRTVRRALTELTTQEVDYLAPVEGGQHWFRGRVAPIRNAEGPPDRVLWFAWNINDAKVAETRLQAKAEQLRLIVDSIPVVVMFQDKANGILMVNREFERALGWTEAECRDCPDILAELFPDPADYDTMQEFLRSGGTSWRAMRTRIRNKNTLDMLWASVRFADGTGIAIGQDVTARELLEARARQSDKLESIGRLAGGIAHDFNNLLTAILGYAELLEDALTERGADFVTEREDLIEIRKAAERARELTARLLAFSRQLPVAPRVINVNALVSGMERLLRRLLGDNIVLSTALSTETGPVIADPTQLEQVLLNLAVNARDAMPSGGRLVLGTRRRDMTDGGSAGGTVVGTTLLAAGEYIELSVTDSGTGMPVDFISQAFEPFVTTKEQGRGTGLGLATVYGVVTQAGGVVVVDSTLGVGTTFRVLLPRAQATHLPEPSLHVSTTKGGQGEVILVAEDDADVRTLTVRTLRDAGYEVLVAEDGEAAIDLAAKPGLHLDLVITDVVMPHRSGWQVAEAIRAERPDVRILFASGFAPSMLSPHGLPERGFPFLAKPYKPSVLLSRVRALLDEGAT